MYLESLAFKRCCFCMPLRRGLIGWGYARLALGLLALIYNITLSIWLFTKYPSAIDEEEIIIVIFICIACSWEIVFNLILIVAGHKKSAKLLSISFKLGLIWFMTFLAYSLYMMGIQLSFTIQYCLSDCFRQMLLTPLVFMAFTFAIFFMHIYVMLMIRSEEKKLRNQCVEIHFVNNAAEGEASCVYASAQTDARTTNMTL